MKLTKIRIISFITIALGIVGFIDALRAMLLIGIFGIIPATYVLGIILGILLITAGLTGLAAQKNDTAIDMSVAIGVVLMAVAVSNMIVNAFYIGKLINDLGLTGINVIEWSYVSGLAVSVVYFVFFFRYRRKRKTDHDKTLE